MNWIPLFNNNSESRKGIMGIALLLLLLAFILPSCASINQSVENIREFAIVEDASEKKVRLSKIIAPLKETKFIFSPIISLKDLNKEGVQKNKFFLIGEIYSKNPEEPISSLSSENCFSPRDQGSINKLERLYQVFIKELGLNSLNANELEANSDMGTHILIQPVLLEYQYCDRADVEIRYLIQNGTGAQTARTIRTSYKAKNFKFPEKDEHHPFFNYNHPGTQFSSLRNALAIAFYNNTLDLLEGLSEEYKTNETN